MTNLNMIMIGSASLGVALAVATPAAAQYYPQPGYAYPQNNGGGVIGAIINSVTGGYGQYPQGNYGYGQVNQRSLVQQCAVAAEQQLRGGYNQGYQQGYGYQNQGGGRVLGITSVQQRGNGGLTVRGVATSGAYGQGYQQGYGQRGYNAGGQADLSFNCRVNNRGQVTNVKLTRNAVRYNRGY